MIRKIFLVVILSLLFANVACQREEFDDSVSLNDDNSIVFTNHSYENFKDENLDVYDFVKKGLLNPTKKGLNTKKNIIDSDKIIEFSSDKGSSYSFLVNRENLPKNTVENLVVESVNDSLRAYLIRYHLSEEFIDSLRQGVKPASGISISRTKYYSNIEELLQVGNLTQNSKTRKYTQGHFDCYEMTIVVDYPCASGEHYGDNSKCRLTGPQRGHSDTFFYRTCDYIATTDSGDYDNRFPWSTPSSAQPLRTELPYPEHLSGGGGHSATPPAVLNIKENELLDRNNPMVDNFAEEGSYADAIINSYLSKEEKLFLEKNIDFNAKIRKLLTEEMHSKEAVGFTKEAVKVKMQGGEVDFFNRLLLDKSFVTNQKLLCIGYRYYITQNNEISQRLKEFLKDGPKGYLKLTANSDFGKDRNNYEDKKDATAITISPKNNIIEIMFNTNSQLNNSVQNISTILVGFSFIHELVHAEIYRILLEASDYPFIPKKNTEEWERLLDKLYSNFYEYFDIYTRLSFETDSPTNVQHELMAQSYVKMMANALAQFDKNQHTQEFYQNIAWTGLQRTKAYDKLSDVQKQQFYNSLKQAKNESKDCN